MADDDNTDDDKLGDGGKKALDAERRARAAAEKKSKDLESQIADLTSRLDKAGDAGKSEIAVLTSKIDDLTGKLKDSELDRWRAEVAISKKLTPAQARRLAGSTKEELEQDADDLIDAFGGTKNDDAGDGKGDDKTDGGDKKPPASSRPTPNLQSGGDPTDTPEETDPRKLAELHKRPGF